MEDKKKSSAKKGKKGKKTKKSKKTRRNVVVGRACLQPTFNNVIVSITDLSGGVIAWSSSGKLGYKGSKKSTPYVAQQVVKDALRRAKEFGLQILEVIKVRGAGSGREQALKAFADSEMGVDVKSIEDDTYFPHNGARKKKKRRV